jgi:hypothetical protein
MGGGGGRETCGLCCSSCPSCVDQPVVRWCIVQDEWVCQMVQLPIDVCRCVLMSQLLRPEVGSGLPEMDHKLTVVKLVTPKAAAKLELLLYEPASGFKP